MSGGNGNKPRKGQLKEYMALRAILTGIESAYIAKETCGGSVVSYWVGSGDRENVMGDVAPDVFAIIVKGCEPFFRETTPEFDRVWFKWRGFSVDPKILQPKGKK